VGGDRGDRQTNRWTDRQTFFTSSSPIEKSKLPALSLLASHGRDKSAVSDFIWKISNQNFSSSRSSKVTSLLKLSKGRNLKDTVANFNFEVWYIIYFFCKNINYIVKM